ncbi:putative dynein arm light chain [Leptomonas pyrrhocoris]|uniref:Putative dynein arm light chain n=1 Tax=Leptomonas pyrrhocoris TaxID=157538 RepID=A0A0M9FY49_LEPPY|nr:putative dynein arm light chain [Leptomonas pyrrhocoris]XP_015656705.1 putative dynein arm light chain [Leptomonas pyrrhocoris]XP_015656706.1 putative dynein arm light chain [Leptomonas pyrrhocoris]KPA78265.1 putative dynein arm light chain [Leptomonas pyrrhocoris]KPA78266.1 putative dynein arm light chain [Leptomonas pyrrhocoris]KPA78267.1 putative dynein arm light chain [Leptomonas pyrrhocoris]|eukprot:XP_015656704.1 putative dynein arm light chain [Leptomonas pyrrhocoris]
MTTSYASSSAGVGAPLAGGQRPTTETHVDVKDLQEAILQLLPTHHTGEGPFYVEVSGPADPSETLIRYDIPYAPGDPKRSLKLRRSHGLGAEERVVDPNVRVVIDSFITPRRWVDAETGVMWVQHASAFVSSRIEAAETQARLHEQLAAHQARTTGTSPIRSLLVAECILEVLRQVTAECWERGLLLLHVHSERVAAQAAHRRLFESRVGHAFRLALKGEKDVAKVEEDMTQLRQRVELLEREEAELRQKCNEFEAYAEEQLLIANKKHSDALVKLKKEGALKRAQLEQQLVIPANLQ